MQTSRSPLSPSVNRAASHCMGPCSWASGLALGSDPVGTRSGKASPTTVEGNRAEPGRVRGPWGAPAHPLCLAGQGRLAEPEAASLWQDGTLSTWGLWEAQGPEDGTRVEAQHGSM